jgi:hypothetical protein
LLGWSQRLRPAAWEELLACLLRVSELRRVRVAARDGDATPTLPELSLDAVLLHAVDEGDEGGRARLSAGRVRR